MSKATAIDEVKAWLTPLLLSACTFLLWNKLDGMEQRITKLENLNQQVTTNTTALGFLQKQEDETKGKLDAHLSAVLPEEIKVKKESNF